MTAPAIDPRPPSFRNGIHPEQHKEPTQGIPIERMPFVGEYVLPLSQHIGAPSKPIVEPGQKVRRGDLIAEPGGFVSTALHAPVTGTVREIELRLHPNGKMMPSIVIEADPYDSQRIPHSEPVDPAGLSAQEMVERVQQSGLVGGGPRSRPT
jgi:electron transport complex protein RnfC